MPIPEGRHTDWPFLFAWIPRKWTAFESDIPPVKICGTETDPHLDIPERGKWVLAGVGNLKLPVYFALTTKSGLHVRIGLLRHDFVDRYYTGPTFTIKKLKE